MPTLVRFTSHGAVWFAVLVPLIVLLSKGWIAFGDNAAIAARSYQSLSLHPPLVGMFSTASNNLGANLFDPGPLLFWLLAIPVHIDPTHGLVWGAALLGGAMLSVAIEAVWSTRQWLGCAVIGLVALDLLWLVPAVFENLPWNAFFPVPFAIASLALAWVVGSGSYGWWPVLVVTGSVAAQSHLTFLLPSIALVLLAPVIGLLVAGRPTQLRWLPIGLAVSLACWLAPLLQDLGSHGNLTALLRSGSGQPTLGYGFGMRMVASAASLSPIWLRHAPILFLPVISLILTNSPMVGMVAMGLMAVVAVVAWTRGRGPLCALSLVTLIFAATVLISFSILPSKNELNVEYLITPLWVLGALFWSVALWSLALLMSAAVQRRPASVGPGGSPTVDPPAPPDSPNPPGSTRPRHRPIGTRVTGGVAILAIVLVAMAGVLEVRTFTPTKLSDGWDPAGAKATQAITSAIERVVRRGPVIYSIVQPATDYFTAVWTTEGVAWRLKAGGWQPGLFGVGAIYTGLTPAPRSTFVKVHYDRTRVTSVERAHCVVLTQACIDRLP